MTNQQIANEILKQLGGNKFVVMTGAKQLGFGKGSLSFKIGRNSSKANMVYIKLEDNDTYTVTFSKFRKMELTELKKYEGVHCDQLESLFQEFTGMATRLF
jgi:hypothetical protein